MTVLNDSQSPAPVAESAPTVAEVLPIAGTVPVASAPDDDAANPLLVQAAALIELFVAMNRNDYVDQAQGAWFEEAPALRGPGYWYEGCASTLMSVFGKKIVPSVDDETVGASALMALQIARVYMSEPLNSPTQSAMEALALVAWRRQQLETRKRARRTAVQRRKRSA